MARPVEQRETYERDTATLVRLLAAVRGDTRRSKAWRERVAKDLQSVIRSLMEPPRKRKAPQPIAAE